MRANISGSPTLSIRTAAHSQDLEEEYLTMKEVPKIVFERQDEQPSGHLTDTSIKDQVDTSGQNVLLSRLSPSMLRKAAHSMSKDSIFDGHSMSMSTDSGIEVLDRVDMTPREMDSINTSRQKGILMRESSRISLPPELPSAFELKEKVSVASSVETKPEFHREWQVAREVHGFWHHLESITRILTTILSQFPNPRNFFQNNKATSVPSACPVSPAPPTSPQLTYLLTEAMMILQEAELTGNDLTIIDE